MKYYIIAGEASGDLHGSNLVKELKLLQPSANIRGWGGDKMQDAGVVVVKHFRDLAFMGFVEVIKNLPTILSNLSFCKKDITQFEPDVVVLVDYPGFNLRIAKWAKQQGFKVVFYISPQVWAWKESRVKAIKKYVDKMLVILPFEKDFYNKWDYTVEYVGHPLVQVVESFEPTDNIQFPQNVIALLPGSRKQEIMIKLPIMLEASKNFTGYNFIVAKAPGIEEGFYNDLLKNYPNVSAVYGHTYNLLSHATAAVVTSGTATLEAALFTVPQVVCYKGSELSYQIARRLVKIKFICLVNLILDKEAVKELIQHDMTAANISGELTQILQNPERQHQIQQDYLQLKALLKKGGNASYNAAQKIVELATKTSI